MKSPGAQSSNEFQWFHIKMGHQDSNKSYQCIHVLTNLRNPTLHLSHIPQYTIQNRHVHISVLNCALWDMGQAHCGICEFWSIVNDEWKSNRFRTRPSFSLVSHCSATPPMMSALGTLNIHKSIPFSLQQIHASHRHWRDLVAFYMVKAIGWMGYYQYLMGYWYYSLEAKAQVTRTLKLLSFNFWYHYTK